mmetsp:Transcript_50124/g.150881  ORF Transcript_50124/g.150881 Transcript_50124/m.150881 type:complete len:326 (-) Transcript_50124:498-1475(-)
MEEARAHEKLSKVEPSRAVVVEQVEHPPKRLRRHPIPECSLEFFERKVAGPRPVGLAEPLQISHGIVEVQVHQLLLHTLELDRGAARGECAPLPHQLFRPIHQPYVLEREARGRTAHGVGDDGLHARRVQLRTGPVAGFLLLPDGRGDGKPRYLASIHRLAEHPKEELGEGRAHGRPYRREVTGSMGETHDDRLDRKARRERSRLEGDDARAVRGRTLRKEKYGSAERTVGRPPRAGFDLGGNGLPAVIVVPIHQDGKEELGDGPEKRQRHVFDFGDRHSSRSYGEYQGLDRSEVIGDDDGRLLQRGAFPLLFDVKVSHRKERQP